MAELRAENSKLVVEERGQQAALGNVILLLVGTTAFLTGLVRLLSTPWIIDTPFLISAFLFLLGLICLLGVLARGNTDARYTLIVDADSLQFLREGRTVKFSREDFLNVEIQVDSARSRKRPAYAVFLQRQDGSYFWVHTSQITSEVNAWASAFGKALNCPVVNATGGSIPEFAQFPTRSVIVPGTPQSVEFGPARYASIQQGPSGQMLVLKTPADPFGRVILSLAALLFLGMPAGFLYTLLSQEGAPALGAAPFLAIFLIMALFSLIASQKYFEVEVRSDQLRARVSLGPRLLSRIAPQVFSRERIVPRNEILQVHVDRLFDSNYRLCVAVRSAKTHSIADRLFFRIGIYASPSPVPPPASETIELWEVAGWNKISKGPVLEDLLFLEKQIQDRLRLEA